MYDPDEKYPGDLYEIWQDLQQVKKDYYTSSGGNSELKFFFAANFNVSLSLLCTFGDVMASILYDSSTVYLEDNKAYMIDIDIAVSSGIYQVTPHLSNATDISSLAALSYNGISYAYKSIIATSTGATFWLTANSVFTPDRAIVRIIELGHFIYIPQS